MNSALQPLLDELKSLDLANKSDKQAIDLVSPLVARWVADKSWLPDECVNCDDRENARIIQGGEKDTPMVLIEPWPGGFRGDVHDHKTWAVFGCISGVVRSNFFKIVEQRDPNYCKLKQHGTVDLSPGNILAMRANDIHSVDNLAASDEISVSLHVYGADLRYTGRKIFDLEQHAVRPHPNLEFSQQIT